MDAVWSRLEAELDRLHRGPQWLADELGCSVQRVVNWRSRGVPPSAYADIARVLGWSVDRLVNGERAADSLSRDALALAEAFDALPARLADGRSRWRLFVSLIEQIDAAAATPGPAAGTRKTPEPVAQSSDARPRSSPEAPAAGPSDRRPSNKRGTARSQRH